jgi:hypothetical protein
MVWKIRFTTEKFREYSDYLERLDFYRQRIFTCRSSGRGHLTYEEALTSEFKSSMLNKQFPDVYVEPLLRKLHGLQLDVDDAIVEIQNYLNTHYFVGENVFVPAKEFSKTEVQDAEDLELEVVGVNEAAKSLQVMLAKSTRSVHKASGSVFASFEAGDKIVTVPMAKVSRKASHALTTEVLFNKMWCSASHGSYKAAPWVVHEALLAKMTNPPQLSTAATKAVEERAPKDKKRPKRKREVADEMPSGDNEEAVKAANESKAKKKKKTAEESEEARSKVHKTSEEEEDLEDDLKLERKYADPEPVPVPMQVSVPLPTKDTWMEVDGAEPLVPFGKTIMMAPGNPASLRFPVRPSYDFEVPQGCFGKLLELMTFLSAFHETLTLSPFPVEDLVAALHYPEYSSLLGEVHHRLLRHLNAHNNNLPKMSAKVWEPNLVYYLKAKLSVFGHVALFAKLKRDGYFALNFSQKLHILLFIAHMVTNSRLIERPATEYSGKKASIIAVSQQAQLKLKRQYKTQKANGIVKGEEEYLSAASLKEKLAAEVAKHENDMAHLASIRTKPLGQDRYHNTYWWFGKNAWRSSADPEAPNISMLESSILVEYHDGNVEWNDPTLEEYASDEEERQDAITYLNTAMPSSSAAALALEVEDEFMLEENADEDRHSRSHREIEYDQKGRPIRKAKLNAKHAIEEDSDEDDYEDSESDGERRGSTCEICGTSTDLHKMLLCDSCDKAHHMYCLQPPLKKIPDGDWFCPVCMGGSLPPPPNAVPAVVNTRAGQQKLLEIQLAAIKKEEEAQRKRDEEAQKVKEREERLLLIAKEKAERIAAQRAIDEAAIAAAKAAALAAPTVVAPTAQNGSGNAASHSPSATASPAAPQAQNESASHAVPLAAPSAVPPVVVNDPSSMDIDQSPAVAPSANEAEKATSSSDASALASSAPTEQGQASTVNGEADAAAAAAAAAAASAKPRNTYNHLQPAPKRTKDLTEFAPTKSTVRWAYYETPEEVRLLMSWLDPKGARESQLKKAIKKKQSAIVGLMERRAEQWAKAHAEALENSARRLTRLSQQAKPTQEPFHSYVNKLADVTR